MDDLIYSLDLVDVPPSKGVYTWNDIRFGPGFIAARLDCFLINNSFLLIGSFFLSLGYGRLQRLRKEVQSANYAEDKLIEVGSK